MKVKELIELLKNKDPEALVVQYAEDGGYNNIETTSDLQLALNFLDPDRHILLDVAHYHNLFITTQYKKEPRQIIQQDAVLIS